MSKPFNFEEFKAGKPAVIKNLKLSFVEIQEDLTFPIVCKAENDDSQTWIWSYTLSELVENFTMLTTKRIVWIAICKCKHEPYGIAPQGTFYPTKEEAMRFNIDAMWQVIDAIPYEIEE